MILIIKIDNLTYSVIEKLLTKTRQIIRLIGDM